MKDNFSIWGMEFSEHRRLCMLMITYACNLKCSYCYESHKANLFMTTDMAKNIIINEANMVKHHNRFQELQIDFMGGEPLVNFDLIKEIVEWLESGAIEVPWICFASTNGTLLTEERKQWFRQHKESITLGASYDGDSNMQIKNRGTEPYNIDLNFFHELWPEQTFQMTVSKETLPTLAKGVLDVQKKGFEITMSLAQGVDWTIDDANLYRKQLLILKEAYINDTNLKPINRLVNYLDVINLSPLERIQMQSCGSGINMVTYDIDGTKYGCHMFTPIVLGKDSALSVDCIDWNKHNLMADDFCKSCVLRTFCPTCPGFNYKYRGNMAVRDKRWCSMVLAEAITACEFQIERISMMDKLSKLDAEHGKAAINAYHILNNFDFERDKSPYII